MKPVSVLVVDDSAVVRQVISEILQSDGEIRLLGVASDPIFAMEKIKREWPDVLVLDVEMPRMDGITFLRQIMATHPTPVVICSTLTTQGARTTLEALAAGAVSIVEKPKANVRGSMHESASEFLQMVKTAARANVRAIRAAAHEVPRKLDAGAILPPGTHALHETTECVVAIGASTGGTQALEVVLGALPRVSPGVVVVQHMPEKFTSTFAERLDSICQVQVKEAAHGDRVVQGRVLIAPGGKHMVLRRNGAYYHVDVTDGPPVNRHRPSVDVLFRSTAKYAGRNALGIILTGMGDDGARGLKEMLDAGAHTIGQDEASCVVYGMPKEAVRHGGVVQVAPLGAMAAEIGLFHATHAK